MTSEREIDFKNPKPLLVFSPTSVLLAQMELYFKTYLVSVLNLIVNGPTCKGTSS